MVKKMELLKESKYYKIIGNTSFYNVIDDIVYNLHLQIINIMNLFQVSHINQIKIFIFDNEKDFKNVTKYPYNLGPIAGAYDSYAIRVYADLSKASLSDLCNCIIHEVIHTIYNYYVLKGKYVDKRVWLDEGLAQNLSGEKEYLRDDNNLKSYLYDNVFSDGKVIPSISFLHKHGNKCGTFVDGETNKYDGYIWSYLIVRYLIETKKEKEFIDIITYNKDIRLVEETLIEDTVYYYKNKLEVDSYDKMDGRTKKRNLYRGN